MQSTCVWKNKKIFPCTQPSPLSTRLDRPLVCFASTVYYKQGCGSGYFVNRFRFYTYRFRFQQNLDSNGAWALSHLRTCWQAWLSKPAADDLQDTLLVKMIAKVSICQHGTATLFLHKTQPRKLSSTHIKRNSTYNNLTLAQGFLTWGAPPPPGVLKSISGGGGEKHICGGKR